MDRNHRLQRRRTIRILRRHLDQRGRNVQARGDSRTERTIVRAAQSDRDAVPVGEFADHEHAHLPGCRDGDRGRCRQPRVDLVHLVGDNADALVDDLDEQAALGGPAVGESDVAVGR